jgi:hypothetical protein
LGRTAREFLPADLPATGCPLGDDLATGADLDVERNGPEEARVFVFEGLPFFKLAEADRDFAAFGFAPFDFAFAPPVAFRRRRRWSFEIASTNSSFRIPCQPAMP